MSISVSGQADVGDIRVLTTNHRGLTPEEIADLALAKIVAVSASAPPPIRDQAMAYKASIRHVLVHYLTMAARSDRTTLHNQLKQAGQHEAAELILKL